jgi:hypothetical protein
VTDVVHERFKVSLNKSQPAVECIADWIYGRGHRALVLPHTTAEHRKDWRKHSDHGDLQVWFASAPDKARIVEVKHQRDHHFTGGTRRDGFKYPTAIVCSVYKWDKANPKPHSVIHVNTPKTHIYVVPGTSHGRWTHRPVRDYLSGEMQETFFVPLGFVTFYSLGEGTARSRADTR